MAEGSNGKVPMSFDEAVEKNIDVFTGMTPVNRDVWYGLLTDLSLSLNTWEGNISEFDRIQIEEFIHYKRQFCLVRTKYRRGNALIYGGVHAFLCGTIEFGERGVIKRVTITGEHLPPDLVRDYSYGEFTPFSLKYMTCGAMLVAKYTDILGRLDALYDQNIDKMGVPIIALCEKTMMNDLLNLFKRTKLNALFTVVNTHRNKAPELFYENKTPFILDKINDERASIMKEFLQEMGVNPNESAEDSTHYVNVPSIRESSLISKFFACGLNKLRSSFVEDCNRMFPDLNLSYRPTIKTYSEELFEGDMNVRENVEIRDSDG